MKQRKYSIVAVAFVSLENVVHSHECVLVFWFNHDFSPIEPDAAACYLWNKVSDACDVLFVHNSSAGWASCKCIVNECVV